MKYDKLSIIMEELKKVGKLHHKLMMMYCGDMTPDQGKLLYLIRNEKMNQKEIANHLHITEATLSVRIKRLVESGLVEREVDRNDKRVYSIVLSPKGEKLMNDMDSAIHHYQEIICKGITNEDYEAVLNVIHKIQNNIKEEIEC